MPDSTTVDETRPLDLRILDAVAAIPAGRVMTYGDVAEYAGGKSGRTVGRVLSLSGTGRYDAAVDDIENLPWHRVIRADGSLAVHKDDEQRQRLLSEGVRFRGDRVDLARHRWDGR